MTSEGGIPAKLPCPSGLIGTHDGTFHCDEVLSCFMLKSLAKYQHAEIIRSRNPEKLKTCDVVVDVGGVYCPDDKRFDHHQRGFAGTMKSLIDKPWTTTLSSAGLVYLHYGRQVIAALLGINESDNDMETLFDALYEQFIEEIDAVDNGINQYDGAPRYKVTSTIGSRVAALNPAWNSRESNTDALFLKAMQMVGAEFVDKMHYLHNSWIPAKKVVASAIDKRFEVDASGEIIKLESFAPWKAHLFDIENERTTTPSITFVLYEDQGGNWRVQCVPVNASSFANRWGLLEAWRGVRDEALCEITGIPGCMFVHASGFIGGNKSYEGALAMARQALEKRVS